MKMQNEGFMKKEELEFLKESNHIEREYGSVALEDVKKAWNYAKKRKDSINVKLIKEIHKRIMIRLNPEIAGKLRNMQVGVMTKDGFREAIHFIYIKEDLDKLCEFKPTNEKEVKEWHIKFEIIHPHKDGNGRTGRILMNIQRLSLGLPILIIHEGKQQMEYYKWFKKGKKDGRKICKRL